MDLGASFFIAGLYVLWDRPRIDPNLVFPNTVTNQHVPQGSLEAGHASNAKPVRPSHVIGRRTLQAELNLPTSTPVI